MANCYPKIPMALDRVTGMIIRPERAIRHPEKNRYRCLDPKCQRELTVAVSIKNRIHFRHFRNMHGDDCVFQASSRPSTIHNAAQNLVVTYLSNAIKKQAPMPILQFETPQGVRDMLPIILGDRVVKEWECKKSGRRADVAVLDQNSEPVLLIEIYHSHKVSSIKREDLSPYWWIEVSAADIQNNPFKWNIKQHGNFPYEYMLLGYQISLFNPH